MRRARPRFCPVSGKQGNNTCSVLRGACPAADHAPFRYIDKGNLATIGRSRAVADVKGVRLSGFLAWAIWLLVHLVYLSGFQNRLLVFVRWTISFLTRGRGARLITAPPAADRPSMSVAGAE